MPLEITLPNLTAGCSPTTPHQPIATLRFTPDFRNWGGGIHTAQNQRLVYFPMLKSGDYELMKPQFDFYLRILRTAELRSETYWNHKGACFAEQLENFGLPNCTEWGWKRPADYDKGLEYNAWLEYEWDTVLEFCLMMLETERYAGNNIGEYIQFIESCLRFFNDHYQYLAGKRGRKTLDGNGHLIIFRVQRPRRIKWLITPTAPLPRCGTVLTRLLELPAQYLADSSRTQWQQMLTRIPPISFRQFWKLYHHCTCPNMGTGEQYGMPATLPCISMGYLWCWQTRTGHGHQHI